MPQTPWLEMLTGLSMTLGTTIGEYAFLMTIYIVTGTLSSPSILYASITIGHLFGKHKTVGAILSYPGIYVVVQIIYTVVMTTSEYFFTNTLIRTNVANTNFYSSSLGSYMWSITIFPIVISVIFYFITNFATSKRLNLE